MAASLVGGAFLSSFVNVLFDRLSDPGIINLIRGKKLSEKMIQRFKTILNAAEALLNDAERRQIREGPVKVWLDDLKDALYEADDLLDEIATKAATQKDPGNFLSRFLNMKDRKVVTRMEDVIARLESIVNQKDTLGLKEIPMENMSWRTPSTSLVMVSDIYGRDKDREVLVKLLLDDANDGDVSVIPIVGMGGIGKTTLAQLVYNDDQVQQKFKLKAWVCVGEVFDVLKVTKTVVEKATSRSCNMNDLDSVQLHLKNEMAGKEFLLVLDDLWSNNYDSWKSFLTPFQVGSVRIKILVTTRDHRIASMVKTIPDHHNLGLLDDDHCWSVFAKHAFLPADSRDLSALEKVGKEIVKKCKGLPLVAQTLGGLLRTKVTVKEWNDVLKSEIWEFSQEESGILPALRISYHYLPSPLKRCFVYCSLYPKDFEFDRHDLVLLWMAEGLLQQPKSGGILESVGHKYFNDFVERSFFQPANETCKNSFVMHDLMHDLATFYGEKFFASTFELKNVVKHDTKTRHLSYDLKEYNVVTKILDACDSLSHVRTLWQINHCPSAIHLNEKVLDLCCLLVQWKRLRVLSLGAAFKIDSLPDSIGKLIHLRYLDLSNAPIQNLPESFSKLYNLQTLILINCESLKRLPSRMQDLVNLRHLNIYGTKLEEMPKGMSKLKDLQYLSNYIVGKQEENGVGELGELAYLYGTFWIEKLENVVDSNEAWKARLVDKKYISDLRLQWSSRVDVDSQIANDVLAKLEPHNDLKNLTIVNYSGNMLPDWLGKSSYHNMTKLELWGCKNCSVLPSFGQLPSLMRLELFGFDMVKKIGAEFYKADSIDQHQETPFRSLKYLSFSRMACLEEWKIFECDDDALFPLLEVLSIRNCPKLRGDLPTFLPSLKKLYIEECSELGCDLPTTPIIRDFRISGKQKARMREIPLPILERLGINGEQQVKYVFEAMTHTQPTSLQTLSISNCSSAISFPGDSLPPSLQRLWINNCKNVEFPMQHQHHHSLWDLTIDNSCDSLTSLVLTAFPNLRYLDIERCENLTSLETVSQSQSLKLLERLCISECPLLSEAIKRKDPHIWPGISHIPQIYVDGTQIGNDSTF